MFTWRPAGAPRAWGKLTRVGVVIWVVFLGGVIGLSALGYRWTKPRSVAEDLRRADDAQSAERADAKTVRDRVFAYVTMYGPRR